MVDEMSIQAELSRSEISSSISKEHLQQLVLQRLKKQGAPVVGTTYLALESGTLESFANYEADKVVYGWQP